jgi:hypothetical protein
MKQTSKTDILPSLRIWEDQGHYANKCQGSGPNSNTLFQNLECDIQALCSFHCTIQKVTDISYVIWLLHMPMKWVRIKCYNADFTD